MFKKLRYGQISQPKSKKIKLQLHYDRVIELRHKFWKISLTSAQVINFGTLNLFPWCRSSSVPNIDCLNYDVICMINIEWTCVFTYKNQSCESGSVYTSWYLSFMSRRNIRSHNKQTFALIKRLSLNTNDLEFKIIENFLRKLHFYRANFNFWNPRWEA